MSSSFLKNFKSLIQKQYQCEISESLKMKQHLYKFRKEFEIRDPDVVSRFPKKELKSFIKIECPINTNDENLKVQEVQQSLKRLRAVQGVKEELVCQNCTKKETCKVINFIPEINETTAKTSLSDLLTTMYYFAVEQENKGKVKIETDQEEIEKDIKESKQNNKKNQKEKADISVEKYRECQNEQQFYKSCASANKLTDTMHIVLDDIYNNLGIETKKFINEYIEEEQRRRFMERIYSKVGNDIELDHKFRKQQFIQKYGSPQSSNNEQSDDDIPEKDLHPLQKKNLKYKKQIQVDDQDQVGQDPFDEGEQANFVQVAGKNKRQPNDKKKDILEKIMNTNQEEGKQFSQMRKQYRNRNDDNEEEGQNDSKYKPKREENYKNQSKRQESNDGKDNYKKTDRYERKGQDYSERNKDNYKRNDKYERRGQDYTERSKDSQDNYKRMDKYERKGQDYSDRYRSQSKDNQDNYKKMDRYERKGQDQQDRNRMQSYDNQRDFKKRDQSNKRQSYDDKVKQSFNEVNDSLKKGKQEKASFDRLQDFDENKLSRFMYKDQKEQKNKIEQEIQLKAQLKEQREVKKFEDDLQLVQEFVQGSDDMLVREVDKKRQPKFAKGSFKFSKTIKKD